MKYIRLISFLKTFLLLITAIFLSSCSSQRFTPTEIQRIKNFEEGESMRIYLITNLSDSLLLRTKSSKINYKKDEKWVRELADKMYKTVTDSAHSGVGIAAPQVGILKQMIVVQRFDKTDFPFEVYINPVIKTYSVEKQECQEGCLSIPDFSAKMFIRAKEIDLEYIDIEGNKTRELIKDFTAVIFQHEIDHLNGILFIDHLKEEQKYKSPSN